MNVQLESEQQFKHIAAAIFKFLVEVNQFTDVTLVCEDHQQIQVHKMILSCVSEFYKEIFLRKSHPLREVTP